MALSHSPSTVMDGLIFNVDFGNIKSTSTGNSFTRTNLIANPSFETDNTGWGGAHYGSPQRQSETGYATTYSRTNLVVNPSFETNATGWSSINSATFATTTGHQYSGSSSLLVTSSSSDYNGVLVTTDITVTPSTPYSFSAYCKNVSGNTRTVYLSVQWFTSAGTYISEINSAGQGTLSTAAGWVRRNTSNTSPSNAGRARLYLFSGTTGLSSGWETAFDAILFEQGTLALRPYFDGSTADAWSGRTVTTSQAWTGTAHASTSTITQVYTNSLDIPAYAGDFFGRILMNSTTDSNITNGSGSQTWGIGRHTASAYFYIPTGSSLAGRTVTLNIESGTAVSAVVTTSAATLTAGQWVRSSRDFNITTAGTGILVARISGTLSTALDEPIYIDAAMIEQTSQLRPYFDGSIVNSWSGFTLVGSASWAGTAHASTSSGTWTGLAYVNDISPSGLVGEPYNAPTYSTSNNGIFNFVTDDYIIFPNSTILDVQSVTIEVWVKLNNLSQNGFIFEKGTLNTQYSLFLDTGASGRLVLRYKYGSVAGFYDLTATSLSSSGLMSTTDWSQIVGTITLSDGTGTAQLFINNNTQRYKTSAAATNSIATNTGGMSIGAYGGYAGSRAYYLNGSIGLIRIYNRVLTDAEVQQNYASTAGRFGL